MPEPLTDTDLVELECRAAELTAARPGMTAGPDLARLVAAYRRLREQVQGHAERIASQSDQLGRRAEKPPAWSAAVPTMPGHYWYRDGPGRLARLLEIVPGLRGLYVAVPWHGRVAHANLPDGGEWAGPISPPA